MLGSVYTSPELPRGCQTKPVATRGHTAAEASEAHKSWLKASKVCNELRKLKIVLANSCFIVACEHADHG